MLKDSYCFQSLGYMINSFVDVECLCSSLDSHERAESEVSLHQRCRVNHVKNFGKSRSSTALAVFAKQLKRMNKRRIREVSGSQKEWRRVARQWLVDPLWQLRSLTKLKRGGRTTVIEKKNRVWSEKTPFKSQRNSFIPKGLQRLTDRYH